MAATQGDRLHRADRERGEGPDRDQRVHARAAVTQQTGTGAQERPTSCPFDYDGQTEDDPTRDGGLGRPQRHPQTEQSGGPRDGGPDYPMVRIALGTRGLVVACGRRRVADGADRGTQVFRRGLGGVVGHEGPIGGQVHRRAQHGVLLGEGLFDAGGTRVAVHAPQGELHRGDWTGVLSDRSSGLGGRGQHVGTGSPDATCNWTCMKSPSSARSSLEGGFTPSFPM
jgi:hypothetical protein